MAEPTIGQKLMRLRERAGLTLADLAAKAGYAGPSSIQNLFNADYNPDGLNSRTARNLAQALVGRGNPPITREDIFSLTYMAQSMTEEFQERFVVKNSMTKQMPPLPDMTFAPRAPVTSTLIPVYGSALAADIEFDANGQEAAVEQTLFEMGEIIMHVERPPALTAAQKIYALYVSGSSMDPRYRPGDPILVDTQRPPSIGDDVVVQLVSPNGEEGITTGLIKTLARRTASFVELEQYQPACRFRVPIERIAHIHRVIPWREAIGM